MLFLSANFINIPEKSSVAFPHKNDISFPEYIVIFVDVEELISKREYRSCFSVRGP
jgi:hypothetical protein